MKTVLWTGTLLLAAALAHAAASPDAKFVKEAAEGGMAEVELGQLAQQKAKNPQVKDFGAMMVKDHTAANEKLMSVVSSKQIKLPSSPSAMQKATKGKLEVLSGDAFDKSYVKGMIKDHKEDIKKFETEASKGQDPDIKAFASATLPTLRMHLEKIQSIASSAGIKE